MTDFGDKLREARQRRGVSLRDIADRTKISVSALESLERSDPSRLPGGIFSRAFVRSYASEVGLDPDVTLREFVDRFDLDPPVVPVQIVPDVPDSERTFDRHQRVAGMILKIIVASLVAVGLMLYLTRIRHSEEQSTAPRTDTSKRSSRRIGKRPSGIIPPQA
jgi:cytoskeleton protein RodZ